MKLTPEDCYYGNLLGIIEMIKSGTTCFSNMYYYTDQAAKAVKESGMRAVLSCGLVDFGNEKRAERGLRKNLDLINTVRREPTIEAAFGPHSPYMCSPDFLCKIQEHAQNLKKIVHIHLHEAAKDIKKFPQHNLVSNVVYSMNASAVDTVVVDGKVIMKDRKILTVDEEDSLKKAQKHAYDVVNK